jgi:hypothetical protein
MVKPEGVIVFGRKKCKQLLPCAEFSGGVVEVLVVSLAAKRVLVSIRALPEKLGCYSLHGREAPPINCPCRN